MGSESVNLWVKKTYPVSERLLGSCCSGEAAGLVLWLHSLLLPQAEWLPATQLIVAGWSDRQKRTGWGRPDRRAPLGPAQRPCREVRGHFRGSLRTALMLVAGETAGCVCSRRATPEQPGNKWRAGARKETHDGSSRRGDKVWGGVFSRLFSGNFKDQQRMEASQLASARRLNCYHHLLMWHVRTGWMWDRVDKHWIDVKSKWMWSILVQFSDLHYSYWGQTFIFQTLSKYGFPLESLLHEAFSFW